MNIREPHEYRQVQKQRQAKFRARRLRRWLQIAGCLLIILVLVGYASYAQALPVAEGEPTTYQSSGEGTTAANQVALNWPTQGEAAIGVLGSGVLAQTANNKALPTASTAKIMVALAVLKKHPLSLGQSGPTITIKQTDVDSYNNYLAQNGSVVAVTVGEQISEYQALQAMLLPSANNIAETLAVWAYGSMPAYLTAANELGQDIGLLDSHFADASGFAPETVSTPRDLVVLGQKAISNVVLKQIFAQTSAQFPGVGTISNTNFMLGEDGIIGIKTGNTDQAGGCYLFAAEHVLPNRRKITVVGAIMGAPTLYRAMVVVPGLLTSFYQGFGQVKVVAKGQTIAQYKTEWEQQADAVAATDLFVYGWQGEPPKLSTQLIKLIAPAAANSPAGKVTATTDYGQTAGQLVLKTGLTAPAWKWRLIRQ